MDPARDGALDASSGGDHRVSRIADTGEQPQQDAADAQSAENRTAPTAEPVTARKVADKIWNLIADVP